MCWSVLASGLQAVSVMAPAWMCSAPRCCLAEADGVGAALCACAPALLRALPEALHYSRGHPGPGARPHLRLDDRPLCCALHPEYGELLVCTGLRPDVAENAAQRDYRQWHSRSPGWPWLEHAAACCLMSSCKDLADPTKYSHQAVICMSMIAYVTQACCS